MLFRKRVYVFVRIIQTSKYRGFECKKQAVRVFITVF